MAYATGIHDNSVSGSQHLLDQIEPLLTVHPAWTLEDTRPSGVQVWRNDGNSRGTPFYLTFNAVDTATYLYFLAGEGYDGAGNLTNAIPGAHLAYTPDVVTGVLLPTLDVETTNAHGRAVHTNVHGQTFHVSVQDDALVVSAGNMASVWYVGVWNTPFPGADAGWPVPLVIQNFLNDDVDSPTWAGGLTRRADWKGSFLTDASAIQNQRDGFGSGSIPNPDQLGRYIASRFMVVPNGGVQEPLGYFSDQIVYMPDTSPVGDGDTITINSTKYVRIGPGHWMDTEVAA